jgi:dihydrofolate reductase
VVASLEDALAGAPDEGPAGAALAGGADAPDEEVWVIGGAAVYAAALPRADRLEVTEVDLDTDGDAFAPRADPADWHTAAGPWLTSRTGVRYRFVTSTRRRP